MPLEKILDRSAKKIKFENESLEICICTSIRINKNKELFSTSLENSNTYKG